MNWHLKKFEELRCEEIYKILKIRNEVFIVEQQCAYQDCDGKDKKSYHLYLEDNGEILCYLRILPKNVSYNEVSIGRVLVNKNYRGKGIAKEMMLKAMNFIEENLNEKEIKIQAQLYLFNFYKSLGFEEVSNEYLEDNIPHIDMLYKKANKY
ncbi:GNAT family acetyltransferase [Clostridium tetani]|uniref:GNAT family N-acetyltransferase n=1 Tax=Clostridium tetani TaxID=1513 RepID=A0ABY0EM39_CLOTA|nr:GNAT family N-acetyltransferase [Clostridium tetani]KHO39451.1 GNAT family acetyltransferase [Clostridium tetani]RXI38784.1 GNAT family N-acetyltransferase [Clostridium tetani]RXI53093.1 GNAT family N-acetyltransferase [Clostridium tetani]RXI67366.1 GNAT family N-acetyltransferase [Clostridium tetani]